MKVLKKMIVIIIILVIIISIILINLLKEISNNEENTLDIEVAPDSMIYSESFEQLDDRNIYFEVKDIVNDYIENIKKLNGDYSIVGYRGEETEEEIISQLKSGAIQSIDNMLDSKYKEDLNIDDNEIINIANSYGIYKDYQNDADYNMLINSIYVAYLETDETLCIVNFSANNNSNNIMIRLSIEKNAYTIFLEDYLEKFNYSKDMSISEIEEFEEIEQNEDNEFSYYVISNETMAKEYFLIQKNNLLNNYEKMYSLLDEEYKQKRFSSYQEFEEYLEEMKEIINSTYLQEYKVEKVDDKMVYKLIDINNNVIILNVNSVLDYTVQLDDYTIETDEFVETYNELSDSEKVYTNIDKYFKMINNKDYTAAYEILDENFKNNNFESLDEFKNYIIDRYGNNILSLESGNVSESGNYYIISVEVSNGEKSVSEKFIVKLNSGTDFVMSFSIE